MARTYTRTNSNILLPNSSFITFTDPFVNAVQVKEDIKTWGGSSKPVTRYTSSDANWKVLIHRNLDATGNYERRDLAFHSKKQTISEWSYPNGQPNRIFRSTSTKVIGWDPGAYVNEADDTATRDLALARLKRKLSDRSNQVNLLIPAVEIRELRGLIRAIAYSGVDLAKALVDIKRTKGKSAAQWASHTWLNWSFALSPTISEAKKICLAIDAELQLSGDKKFTDYGAAKKKWSTRGLESAQTAGYHGSMYLFPVCDHELSYRFTCGYKTPFRAGNNYSAADSFGLEMGALVPAIWELTAFSWLADYFGTIGAYLEDTFVTDTNQTVYVVESKKYRCFGEFHWKDLVKGIQPNVLGHSVQGENTSFEWFYTKRTALPALPRRSLRFKTRDEIGANAINKVLNLGSVLVGGKAFSNRIK